MPDYDNVNSWAFKEAKLILDRVNNSIPQKGYVLFETGYGPSGLPHIGTFGRVNDGDMTIVKKGVTMVIDPMSLQYLVDGEVDYIEGLEGSRFLVNNPNASTTCGCGSSFSI